MLINGKYYPDHIDYSKQNTDFSDTPIDIEGYLKEPESSLAEMRMFDRPYTTPNSPEMEAPAPSMSYDPNMLEGLQTLNAAPEAPVGSVPEKSGSREGASWKDWMVGATPILMGFLTGEQDVGYAKGAEGFQGVFNLQEERAKEDRTLQAKIAARKPTSLQKAEYQDASGVNRIGVFDPVSGQVRQSSSDPLAPKKAGLSYEDRLSMYRQKKDIGIEGYQEKSIIRRGDKKYVSRLQEAQYRNLGKNKQVIEDRFGDKVIVDKSTSRMEPILNRKDTQMLPDNTRKWVETQQKLVSSAAWVKEEKDFNIIRSAYQSMGKGNRLADKIGFMRLVKQIEQRLSDKDRDYYAIPSFGQMRAWLIKNKNMNAETMPNDILQEGRSLLQRAVKDGEGMIRDKYNRIYSQGEATHGMRKTEVKKHIGGTLLGGSVKMMNPETMEKEEVPASDLDYLKMLRDEGYVEL